MSDIELLKASRKILNVTAKQLAGMLGVAHVTVRQWESGARKPSPEVFKAILERVASRIIAGEERQQFIDETAAKLRQ